MNSLAGIIQVTSIFLNVVIFAVIRFNDLAHLSKRVEELSSKIEEHGKELKDNGENIAMISGMLKGMTKYKRQGLKKKLSR